MFKLLAKSMVASSIDRTKIFAVYRTIIRLVPPVTMLITSFILFFFPWQAAFIFLVSISIFIFWYGLNGSGTNQSSTEHKGFIVNFKIYWILLKDKRFLPLIISYGLIYAIMAPFYVTSIYTLTHILHYQVHVIGLITALFTAANMAGAYTNILVKKTKLKDHILAIGFSLALLGVFVLYIGSLLFPPSLVLLVAPLMVYCFGADFFYAQFNVLFMDSFEQISRSVTLSAMAVFIALITSISTLLTSFHGHETISQTSLLMLVMVILSIGLYNLHVLFADARSK